VQKHRNVKASFHLLKFITLHYMY